jgi:hypothetical protein
MPLVITSESYNGQSALQANAGDWVDGVVDFAVRFQVGSGYSNKITYNEFSGQYRLSIQQGDFGERGFLAGDAITLNYNFIALVGIWVTQSFPCTILFVNGNEMFIDQPFALNPVFPPNPTFTHINGRQFPTENYVSGLSIIADKQPASAEFEFNLTPNGSFLLNSMLDNEINRFELDVVTGIPTGVPQPMQQLTNMSGGLLKDVTITLVSTPGDAWRNYRINYRFWQWGIIQDGIEPPNYYATTDCLAPIAKVKAFAEYGNPNGVQIQQTENVESNTGFFDENYNGGLSLYTSQGSSWIDALGDTIDKLDNSGTSTFEAVIDAPNQVNPNSTYRIGLVWRPINGTYYQNKQLTNVGENLLLVAPEIDFIADGVADPTIYQGYEDENGARWDFQNIKFEITGANEITVTGDVIPNAQAGILFAGVPDGGRKSTLWVSIGDYTLDGQPLSKRVSLRIFDEDNYDAPTLGVQIPYVLDEAIIDHGGNDVSFPLPQTTTEDDVLYRSNFQLIAGVPYEGIRANIHVYNTVSEEQFTLEEIFFSFASVPQILGVFQPNFVNARGFNLPPTSDRNHISLVRNPANDVGGLYGITIEYGYLSRWEYWLSQPNVDNDFFDILEMWNGKNKNWQRFSNSGDWVVRIAYFTRVNGVDDFNYNEVGIRPYEDDINLATTWDLEVLSSGVVPTNLVANELHEITATLVWAIGAYTNPWAEMTIEDFESGNRWVISSVLAHGGIASNPLQPIAGATELDMTFPAVNIAVLKAYLDTNVISANKVCVSARIYSEDEPLPPIWEFLIGNSKDAERAYSDARKLSVDAVYAGALIRVRRSSDNAELDIMPVLVVGEWVLDEVSLLNFVGAEAGRHAWIVTRYDQAWNLAHAVQPAMNSQAPIVIDGVVVLDPDTGRPAHLCNGLSHWYPFAPDQPNSALCLSICVFGIEAIAFNPQRRIGFGHAGTLASNFPYSMLWFRNGATIGIVYDGVGTAGGLNNVHFAGQLQTGAQLNMMWRVAGNNIAMRLNGVNGNVINEASALNAFNCLERSRNNYHRGYKTEDVYYGSDMDETPVWIENNVNNFYQIF